MKSNIRRNDDWLEFSGPSVWPKITAHEAVDRFIFRRPERAYLEALDEIDDHQDQKVLVKIREIHDNGARKKSEVMGKWHHTIRPEPERKEDVAEFLLEMRGLMKRVLPDRPRPGVVVQIKVYFNEKYLSSFQGPWL